MKRLVILCFLGISLLTHAQQVQTALVYSVNPSNGVDKRPPLLILLHGYGSNESDLFDLAKAFDPRFITIALRGPNAIGGGGFNWYELRGETGQRKYTYSEAVKSRKLILDFISQACRAFQADSNRVFIMGFSQGAIMCYELALAAPGKIFGIVPMSGRLMDESRALKTDWNKLAELRVFIAHGTSDNVIPIDESQKADAFFKEHKLKHLSFQKYEMMHTISGAELNDLKRWFSKALEPKPVTATK
jgi:phospholipase/carboxylesterase